MDEKAPVDGDAFSLHGSNLLFDLFKFQCTNGNMLGWNFKF